MQIVMQLTCADGVTFDFANCFDSPICGFSDRKPFQFISLNQQKQHQRTQMGQRWRTHLSNLARWLLTRPKGRLSGGCVPCFNSSPSPLTALPLASICTSLFLLHWTTLKWIKQTCLLPGFIQGEWKWFCFTQETFILLPNAEIMNFSKIIFGGLPWIF